MRIVLRHVQARQCMLATVLGVLLAPGAVHASWIGFRNDTDIPVVVQGASVVNHRLRWGKPHLLYPGELCWDCIVQAGKKQIVVCDAKKRVLARLFLKCGTADQFFSVQPDGPGQAKLTRTRPPASSKKASER